VELGMLSQAPSPTVERASLRYTAGTGMMGEQMIDHLLRETIQAPIREQNKETESSLGLVDKRLVALETKLAKLIAKGDERAINFAGLGFQSISKSNAWLETELVQHPSGLIVNLGPRQ
jgi:hypothetical protein